MSESNKLTKYKEYIEKLAKDKSREIFLNATSGHAAVAMSVLFNNTRDVALMFSHGLKPDVTTDEFFLKSFANYIERGGKLFLLLEDLTYFQEPDNFTFLKKSKDVHVKVITTESKKELLQKLKLQDCNFDVFDNKMIRLEYSPDEYKAIASFNYAEMAEHLSKVFYEAFNNATVILN